MRISYDRQAVLSGIPTSVILPFLEILFIIFSGTLCMNHDHHMTLMDHPQFLMDPFGVCQCSIEKHPGVLFLETLDRELLIRNQFQEPYEP